MARYRKVEVATWSDDRFLSLTQAPPNAQTLWIYLLCGPRTTTFPGLVVAREEVIASDLGWFPEGFREAFTELSANALVKADWRSGVVFLRKALFDGFGDPRETAKPSNPNQLKSWAHSWETIPECDLKFEYLQQLGLFSDALGETFGKAFREAFAKPLAKALARPSPIQETGNRTQEAGDRNKKNSAAPSAGGSLPGFQDPSDRKVGERKARKGKRVSDATDSERATARLLLDKLGSHTDTQYSGIDDHVRLIVGRLRDGITEWDLRCVIGYCAHPTGLGWTDKPDQIKYLRPETLFGPKTISRYLDAARSWSRKHISSPEPQGATA